MKNKAILTIGIPTFNRKAKLASLISLIAVEFDSAPEILGEVVVLVSDNASGDGTWDFVKSASYSWMNIIRNERNLGFDGNISSLYEKCTSEYIWFLSDDDRFHPGSVLRLLNIIKLNEGVGLVILPHTKNGVSELGFSDKIDLIPYNPVGELIAYNTNKKTRIDSSDQKLRLVLILLSAQISSCVIRVTVANDIERGGGVLHSGLVNLNLLNTPYYYIPDCPFILGGAREYYSTWFMESTLFGVREMYEQMDSSFDKEIITIVTTQTCRFALRLLRRRYLFSDKNFVRYKEVDDALVNRLRGVYKDDFKYLKREVNIAKLYKFFKHVLRVLVVVYAFSKISARKFFKKTSSAGF